MVLDVWCMMMTCIIYISNENIVKDDLAAYESGPLEEWSLPQWRKLFITRTLASKKINFFG